MTRFARILMLTLLAVFAAGTVAHAVTATTMSAKMAMADVGAMDMADCEGCGGDDDSSPLCDLVCVSPLLAKADPGEALQPVARESFAGPQLRDIVSRTGPPDPYPPRSFI